MTEAIKTAVDRPVFGRRDPDARGYFGDFGGRFVPETLVAPIEELTAGYYAAADEFKDRLQIVCPKMMPKDEGYFVIYTDSIPIFALLSKAIYHLFHVEFFYFGLWYGLSYLLQGIVAAALSAVMAAGVMVWNVLTMSLRQLLIPEHMFGRVQGAYRTVVWGAIPVGALAGGVVADLLGVPAVFVVSGAVLLLLAGVLWLLLRAHAAELTDEALAEEVAVPA